MATLKTLAEQIVDAARTGHQPSELSALDGLIATASELNKLSNSGAVVASGTQTSNIADASTTHALSATFSDTEVEAALNALGTKINLIIAALEAFGIAASS